MWKFMAPEVVVVVVGLALAVMVSVIMILAACKDLNQLTSKVIARRKSGKRPLEAEEVNQAFWFFVRGSLACIALLILVLYGPSFVMEKDLLHSHFIINASGWAEVTGRDPFGLKDGMVESWSNNGRYRYELLPDGRETVAFTRRPIPVALGIEDEIQVRITPDPVKVNLIEVSLVNYSPFHREPIISYSCEWENATQCLDPDLDPNGTRAGISNWTWERLIAGLEQGRRYHRDEGHRPPYTLVLPRS